MATKDYGQTYYTNPTGVAANVPVEMEKLAESLEGRTVMSFASTSARDTALTSLTSDQKKGVVAHVQGKGWYGFDGSTWFQFSTSPTKGGRIDTVAETNNMFRIPSAQCFFDGAAPTSIVCMSATTGYDCEFGTFDGAGALIKLFNRVTGAQLGSGSAGAFYWLAMK